MSGLRKNKRFGHERIQIPSKNQQDSAVVTLDFGKSYHVSFDGSQSIFKVGNGVDNNLDLYENVRLFFKQLMLFKSHGEFFAYDIGKFSNSLVMIEG